MKSFNTLRGFSSGDEPEDVVPRIECHATLRIFSEGGLDFEEIGRTLGVKPTTVGRRGDRKGPRSPPNKGDIWMYRAPAVATDAIERHVEILLDVLRPHGAYIQELKGRAIVEVLMGYSSNIDHGGLKVPHQLLGMLSALQLDLNLYLTMVTES